MRSSDFPLSGPMVVQLFGPLVRVSETITFHHLRPLQDFAFHLWRSQAPRTEWMRRLRAALYILQDAADWHPRDMGLRVYPTMDAIGPIHSELAVLGQRFWSCERAVLPDDRYRPIFDLYTCLYERLYPLAAAPVVAADALLRVSEVGNRIADDGRVRLHMVEQLEVQRDFPPGLLTAGLDRHMRNSISHGRYQILSRDTVRMEDRDPSGKITWGPQDFSHADLWERTLELDLTCRALMASLIMFDVNNHTVFQARGYIPPRQSPFRMDIAEALIREYAEEFGFRLERMQQEDAETVLVELKVAGYREEGPSEILAGLPAGGAIRYTADVRTEDVPISRQVYSVLQLSLDVHDAYECFIVEVLHEDGAPAGRLRTSRLARHKIFEGTLPFEEVRRLADQDTLSDVSMPVVVRGWPRHS